MSRAPDQRRKANRLAKESSPYLLQHAHNPVDWFPWGQEAFDEARRRNVPIFLSIGYSTCYWCHVMERESFESEDIAALMNREFVCVKVDREERPDLDDVYMAATQMTTGHGGWPMSVFLEPEQVRPFYCGTYFPPEERGGMRSFPQILGAIAAAWKERREQVVQQSETLANAVREHLGRQSAAVPVGLAQVSQAAQTLLRMLDRVNGGFGSAPKFPQPVFLELLLDVREAAADEETKSAADAAIRLTLDKMACGGMHDQVGGGFHRYSVDEKWLVPHFEKMLYDNAQLAALYARAAALYGDPFYERVARRTVEYVLREMTQGSGAFFSAQDAEVDGREGLNYLWTASELGATLSEADGRFALKVYGVDQGTNFRDPHHPEAPAANVLFLAGRPEGLVRELGTDVTELWARIDAINDTLYRARLKRKQPRLDDKVIAGWNGIMIGALARSSVWLKEPRYARAASRAATFVMERMRNREGHLLRTSRGEGAGAARIEGVLEDYAFVIDGLLALHVAIEKSTEVCESVEFHEPLTAARELMARAQSLFGSPDGGFFDTRADQADLFVRARSTHDGAMASGSSVMLANLAELHELTGDGGYRDAARSCLMSVSGAIAESPVGTANAVRTLLRMVQSGVVTDGGEETRAEAARERFTPVEIFATEERVAVGRDRPASLRLVLKIADGYHINAADPGAEGLVGLRVWVVNGGGIAAYADYPKGEGYGERGELRVHRGSVEFDVAVEQVGDITGQPLLAVTFQACTDRECLAPMTAELAVAIDAEQ
ncbi:MAG: DUF255 domain-containing protein [Phycisphaeraceae bacterium]|nr:DUF255 domain-containing protein [Phycisphaeraceae bacterium]